LKKKVDCGREYLTTQLFFDNNVYLSFVDKCRAAGIDVPIIAGIMLITSVRQFERTALLSGSAIPGALLACAELFSEDADGFRRAGMEFAKKQITALYERGVRNIHVYTMNNPGVAAELSAEFRD
jgi:methylenetetrahydrofolate reductase (NADPH)